MKIESQIASSSGLALERFSVRVEQFLQRHRVAIVVFLSLIYFAGTIFKARSKPFGSTKFLLLLRPSNPATLRRSRLRETWTGRHLSLIWWAIS